MSLKERITEDMKNAMRAKEAERLLAIRMLLAAVKQKEVDERIALDDAAVVAIVDKLVKQRKESITLFSQAGRDDLVAKETAELQILEAYLPARLGADEINAQVAALVAELGAESGHKFGAADMGLVSAAVKRALQP
ncbi:MAG: GatB/YqeY domain-containing protein [Burkholderiales bacterium]